MAILTELTAQIGRTWVSQWLTIDQAMIDAFAGATLDRQFLHVDPARAAGTPFGGTVAHGFLTLSLLSHLAATTPRPPIPGIKMAVNYGLDRVRFVSAVRSGSRVRGHFTLIAIEEKQIGRFQQSLETVVEIEGAPKPALTATWIGQFFV